MFADSQESFFHTLQADLKALIKGNASPEQKERLTKQAAVTLMVFSIALYGVAAWGAMQEGQELLPLQLGGFPRPRGPLGRRPSHRYARRRRSERALTGPSRQDVPFLPSASMTDLFNEKMPSPFAVLRDDDSPFS